MFGTAYHPGSPGPQTGPSPFVMHVPTTLLEYDLALGEFQGGSKGLERFGNRLVTLPESNITMEIPPF